MKNRKFGFGGSKKGGMTKKRYADGDLVMGGAASDTSGLSLGMPSIDTDLRRALTDKELMDANLAAVRAREAASTAKPKPKPKAVAPKPEPKAEAPEPKPKPKPKPETPAEKPSDALNARARQIMKERETSFTKGPLTMAEALKEAAKTRVPAPSVTRGYADRGARTLADRKERVAKNAATEAARPKKPNIFQRLYDMTVNPGVDKKYAKGGKVSSRADGCAVRGKTRGKIC